MAHESNPQLELAFNFLQYTNQNVFLTGKAGTGKTTFLQDLKLKSPKRMVVVAPTGVAAINAGGVTIHSFFQMSFGPHVPVDPVNNGKFNTAELKHFSKEKINIIRSLDLLVIDEISMVRADLLDGIDEVLRRYKNRYKPFGGVQLLMIGDLQQLSPVVKEEDWSILRNYYDTCYFFSSHALKKSTFIGIELKHIFRQSDQHFIDLLNKVRLNQLDEQTLLELNKRYIPDFHPDQKEGYITLTTHNYQSKSINDSKLNLVEAKSYLFLAEVNGEFPDYSYPTNPELELKKGAQVMFIKNDPSGDKLFFNGKIGKVIDISSNSIEVMCPHDDQPIKVAQTEWENCRYKINEQTQEIEEEVIGTFKQYPLKLAWAITIHKSQGLTFEKAIIDARESFAHGQVYVALSRCKSLQGLVLSTRLGDFSIKNDTSIGHFTNHIEHNQPGPEDLELSKKKYVLELLLDLFDFKRLLGQFNYLLKMSEEHSSILLGTLQIVLKKFIPELKQDLMEVSLKFEPQLKNLIFSSADPEENPQLQERIKKAAEYFSAKFQTSIIQPASELSFETDNKTVRKSLNDVLNKLGNEIESKKKCLEKCKDGFFIKSYLETKSKSSIEPAEKTFSKSMEESHNFSEHPELYSKLKKWRQRKADILNLDINKVIPQKTLNSIANQLPVSRNELKSINGMSKNRMQQFAKDILSLIIVYRKEKGMEVPLNAEKEAEKAGLSSKAISLDLLKQGKSIQEIASERGLTTSTIESHLVNFIATGELELDKVVPPEDSKAILEYLENNKPESMTEVFNAFNSKYSYSHIRFVLKFKESDLEKTVQL